MRLLRLKRLAEIFLPFASLEALTQVVTAAAGLMVVRLLPVNEFAVYAIAVAAQGSLAVLSDIGVSSLLLARAGRFSGDPARLARLLNAARTLRLRLFIVVMALAAPILWWSLAATRPTIGSWAVTLGFVLAIVALQVSATVDGTMTLALLRPALYQSGQLCGSLVRLVGVLVLLSRARLSWVGLAINLVGTGAQTLYLRSAVAALLPRDEGTDADDDLAFRRGVRGQLINAAYYAFSSQVTLWLVGLLSNSQTVAEVGALGRISSILVLAQGGVIALVAPRIARYREPKILLRRYLQIVSSAMVGCGVVFAGSCLYPGVFLALIGSKYAGLGSLLPLAMGGTLIYALSVTIYSLNAARGWIEEAWISIPLTLILQAMALFCLDVSRLRDALLFGFCSSIPPFLVQALVGVRRFRREFIQNNLRSASI